MIWGPGEAAGERERGGKRGGRRASSYYRFLLSSGYYYYDGDDDDDDEIVFSPLEVRVIVLAAYYLCAVCLSF